MNNSEINNSSNDNSIKKSISQSNSNNNLKLISSMKKNSITDNDKTTKLIKKNQNKSIIESSTNAISNAVNTVRSLISPNKSNNDNLSTISDSLTQLNRNKRKDRNSIGGTNKIAKNIYDSNMELNSFTQDLNQEFINSNDSNAGSNLRKLMSLPNIEEINNLNDKINNLQKSLIEKDNIIYDLINRVTKLESIIKDEQNESLLKKFNDKLSIIENKLEIINNSNQTTTSKSIEVWAGASALFGKDENPSTNSISKLPKSQTDIINTAIIENEARERKKNNIMIFGLKLNDQNTNENINKEIIDIFCDIGADSSKINKVVIFKSKNGKIPPIQVQLSPNYRNIFFSLCKNLSKNKKYEKVFISSDMTITERNYRKELIEIRNKNNELFKKQNINLKSIIKGSTIKNINYTWSSDIGRQ